MAIIQCNKCGKKYSDKAPGCPNCAKENKVYKKATPVQTVMAFVVIFALLGFSSIFFSGTGENTVEPKREKKPYNYLNENTAYMMSKKFVKARLLAPATADFPWTGEATIKKSGPGEFTVLSYVDAQNAFGAQIRKHYVCKIKSEDNGKNWELVEFAFARQ